MEAKVVVIVALCLCVLTPAPASAGMNIGSPESGCPNFGDIQDQWVMDNFDMSKFEGTYYEIGMKDATQPRICGCQRSVKKWIDREDRLSDQFSLSCAGKSYVSDLSFKKGDKPGYLHGQWRKFPLMDKVDFPDVVLDIGVKKDPSGHEYYAWVIEFQCIQVLHQKVFYAFNFYSRDPSGRDYDEMEASARRHGLGPFLDSGRPIKRIDHTDCTYPKVDFSDAARLPPEAATAFGSALNDLMLGS